MNTAQTVRLLRMCHSLFKVKESVKLESEISLSVARDLYDFIEETTEDQTIKMQMDSARGHGYDRKKCLNYLKYRLNLEI